MPEPPPETLAWLRHAASCGKADAQLTLHILERLEALEARPISGFVELAADCSALDARAWAYIGKQAMCGDFAATALIDLLNKPSAAQPAPVFLQRFMEAPMDAKGYLDLREPPAAQPAPPVAPAGGLVDEICRQLPLRPVEIRAAIRLVAAWLRQRKIRVWSSVEVANDLEHEADR
jgi:hypothetical protein